MKKDLKEETPNKNVAVFIRAKQLRNLAFVAELLDKHGCVFINIPDGAPIRISRANVS